MTTKKHCQSTDCYGSNPNEVSNRFAVFEGCNPDSNPHRCKCEHSRLFIDEASATIPLSRGKTKRKCVGFLVSFLRFHLSSRKSFKFFVYVFIYWTLIFAPLIGDLLQSSLHLRLPPTIGGVAMVRGCHPGNLKNGGNRIRPPVNQVPFQRNEFVPKMSEQTIGASGPAEGPIYRDSKRYNTELVANFNPDIVFEDEEQTNEDRMMTQICKDKINVLAVAVLNQWPGVKLRVTEGWDDPVTERTHPKGSLHYEGRAVDITTSDLDRSKYPVLARLAANAGFDWVLYKQSHVHCSVKSESSGAAGSRGCFPGNSRVPVPGDKILRMDELSPGDQVYSVDSSGRVVPDTILTFMDINRDVVSGETVSRSFVFVETESGINLRLTQNHLIHSSKQEIKNYSPTKATAVFAGNLRQNDYIYVSNTSRLFNSTVRPSRIVNITRVKSKSGAFAPLTSRGTILVNGAMTSCYAVIESEWTAHLAVSPLRYYYMLRNLFTDKIAEKRDSSSRRKEIDRQDGILLYARILFEFGRHLIPEHMFWGE